MCDQRNEDKMLKFSDLRRDPHRIVLLREAFDKTVACRTSIQHRTVPPPKQKVQIGALISVYFLYKELCTPRVRESTSTGRRESLDYPMNTLLRSVCR